MNNTKKNTGNNILIHAVTPLIVLAFCIGIIMIALIKPSDKLKVYKNLIFMDDLKIDPDDANIGLIIKDNEITEDYSGETYETGELIRPVYGEMYAIMKSDALELDVPVYWGSDVELFERGACQASSSAVIGDDGNTVISAHVDTFFSDLEKLKEGDSITLLTNYGEFTYTVKELISFKSSNNKYVNPSQNEDKLTLYTCKKDILGASDERIGVICELTERKFYKGSEEGNVN